MQTVDILRWGLFFSCAGMLVIALLFLGQRRLKTWQKMLWGALALCLPLLGPFLLIYCRPGERQLSPPRRPTRLHWDTPAGSQRVRRVR
jgi:hypothetical protein